MLFCYYGLGTIKNPTYIHIYKKKPQQDVSKLACININKSHETHKPVSSTALNENLSACEVIKTKLLTERNHNTKTKTH